MNEEIKQTIELQWKEFNVSVSAVKEWVETNYGTHFRGASSDSILKLHFVEVLDAADEQAIKDYWDAITEESAEAAAYYSKIALEAAVTAAKEDAVTKSWDNLSVEQKKLIAGVSLSDQDNQAILLAFSV